MELSSEQINEIVKNITMYKVMSTNIMAIGYDKTNRVMRVIFKGNSSYLYFGVEPEIYSMISLSESKGKTLNEQIIRQKDKYKYIKLI